MHQLSARLKLLVEVSTMDKEHAINLVHSIFMDDTDTINPAFDDRVESVTELQELIVAAAEENADQAAVISDLTGKITAANTELNRKRLELLDLKDPESVSKKTDDNNGYDDALDALDNQVKGAE